MRGMTDWQLAQINVGRMVAPQGDPVVQPFFDALDGSTRSPSQPRLRLAPRRRRRRPARPTIQATADPLLLINMSVWTDADSLFAFVYRSATRR